ncbi:uncharacterized protein [Spinacia oleracea]|uniref:Endonuclease/exonuclease/phosphatase domain-containing protein n=1 Tax=Spinacia oleracea TaxID=3562 RepID=A0ABM3RJ64_SPIOL|nr:uncharacterized protein LOC130470095 [Spinacia oleracea]
MSSLCWNCRGLGNPRSVAALQRWCAFYGPELLFVSETMINKSAAEMLKHGFGYSSAIGVSSVGKAGGLCLFWNEGSTSFNLISFSQHHISGEVVTDAGAKWCFVGVCGWSDSANKHKTWALICKLCNEYNGLVLVGGDFNEILHYEEKEGGADTERRAIPEFREMMDDCNLRDLGYRGLWYTWERGVSVKTKVRERLDRFVGNSSWCNLNPEAHVEHLVRFKSDHTPIMLSLGSARKKKGKRRKRRGFRFETKWLLDEGCVGVVKQA